MNARYPGCACDIPSHNYAYSFAPNPAWTDYYASSSQIQEYMKDVSNKYNCDKFFTYRHKVTNATWNEEAGYWKLNVLNLEKELEFSDSCDVLINAGGVLK